LAMPTWSVVVSFGTAAARGGLSPLPVPERNDAAQGAAHSLACATLTTEHLD
jgi:hypothetical protein